MGWDKGRYYTRSKRVNGRVVREYVGSGVFGQLAEQLDLIERETRKLHQLEERSEREELESFDSSVDEPIGLRETSGGPVQGKSVVEETDRETDRVD